MLTQKARFPILFLTVSLSLLVSPAAFSQDGGFNGHGFHPTTLDGDLRDLILVQRPGSFVAGDVSLGTLFEYTTTPLYLYKGQQSTALLDDLFVLNANYSLAVHDRVRLTVGAPLFFTTHRTDYESYSSPDGYTPLAFGDTRIQSMIVIIRPKHIVGAGGLGVGINTHLDLPTGASEQWLGNSSASGGATVAVTMEAGPATFTGNTGMQTNPEVTGLGDYEASTQALLGMGIGLQYTNYLGASAEILTKKPLGSSETGAPSEAIFSLRAQPESGVTFTGGISKGLSAAPGTPPFRVFFGIGGINITRPRPDIDLITAFESNDDCPIDPETMNGWLDDDGCPDELASLAVSVQQNGHPVPGASLELEGPDGVTKHVATNAPLTVPEAMPGTTWRVKATHGKCLSGWAQTDAREGGVELIVALQRVNGAVKFEVVDAEGALLPDVTVTFTSDDLACIPTTPQPLPSGTGMMEVGVGSHTVTITAPGHKIIQRDLTIEEMTEALVRVELEPALVQLEQKRIVIMDRVHFETAKAIIKSESFALLDEVAEVIRDNEAVGRVQIAGHTDSKGNESYNERLSQQRADSVRSYLIKAGVPANRLVAIGYGESAPIDTNATRAGRANNRRVEFNLIDQTE